jgi:hypothetical protein
LLAATVGTWPAARCWVAARVGCVVTAHRLRAGCAQAWIHTRQGRLPVILLTRPIPGGEQAHLWCRAGTSVEDFESARDLLRAACWAHEVHVSRSTRYSHIVIVDVIRRGPPAEQAADQRLGRPVRPANEPVPHSPGQPVPPPAGQPVPPPAIPAGE